MCFEEGVVSSSKSALKGGWLGCHAFKASLLLLAFPQVPNLTLRLSDHTFYTSKFYCPEQHRSSLKISAENVKPYFQFEEGRTHKVFSSSSILKHIHVFLPS